VTEQPGTKSKQPSEQTTLHLRRLAHDLSNSLETILQAGYLLSQTNLDSNGKKWVQLIDTATQDAARLNREIRDILKGQA
jgi:nitrogen-specific signal transduction histidine kinase